MPHRIAPLLVALTLAVAAAAPADAARPRGPARFRVQAAAGETLLVHGTYPSYTSSCTGEVVEPVLHERYRGAVEVARSSDGDLYLVGELPFEDYLKGIAEVPRSWPIEALKAQVVAARSYAVSQLDPGGEYDLCATDACQVYQGTGVEGGAWGERWVRAVEETAGEILLHEGEPAVTYYSSTSNGRTYDVEEVFGGSALPYLRGIREADDRESPLAWWEVRVPLGDLRRFLERAGSWPGGRIRAIDQQGGRVTISGRRRVVLSREELRDDLNATASCLEPASYPPVEDDGYRLPQTVPSRWYRAEQEGDAVVLRGRGWGHGVGMVQWGAYGKAKRGLGYGDILAAYYGGLRPQASTAVPDTIRVLVASDLTSVTLVPSGDADASWDRAPEPPWRISIGPRRLRIERGSAPDPQLDVGRFRADPRSAPGRRFVAALSIEEPARVRLQVLRDGDVVGGSAWDSFDDPVARVRVPFPRVRRGDVQVRAIVTDGVDTVTTPPRTVRVVRAPARSPSPSPSPSPAASPTRSPAAAPRPAEPPNEPASWVLPGVAGGTLLVALALAVLTLRRHRGLHRP